MGQMVDPERLKLVRQMRKLTQEELAKKARLNKQTVYRLERGGKPPRNGTLERIARALDVEPGVLTGEAEIPTGLDKSQRPDDEIGYQLNVRLDGQIRNAFFLASLHYKVPVRRIVELAPLLFVLAAEGSLRRRGERLAELEAALDRVSDEWSRIPHFPTTATESIDHRQIIEAEKKSITARDLFAEWEFGSELQDRDDLYESYESSNGNPFVFYLRKLADAGDEAVIDPWGPKWHSFDIRLQYVDYAVCWSEAVELSGGEQRLAAALYFGLVPLHEMPRELQLPLDRPWTARWTAEGDRQRIEWIRQQAEQQSDYLDRIMENRPAFLQEQGVLPILSPSRLIELADGDKTLAQKLGVALCSNGKLVDMMPLALRQLTGEKRAEWLRLVLDQGEDPVSAHNAVLERRP